MSICVMNKNTNTCLNDTDINKFIQLYNDNNIDKIKNKQDYINKFGGKNEWRIIKEKIFKNDKEFYNELKHFTFKPFIKKYGLVTNFDIENVFKQFEYKHKNFSFLGAHGCDFYNYLEVDEFKKFIKKMFSNKYSAMILNTGKTNTDGEHWVAVFVDNNLKQIEYFDSLGDLPNKFIKKFLNTLQKYDKTFKFISSFKEIQKENRECGIYAIRYIIKRLYGDTSYNLMNSEFSDKKANAWREKIFRL